MQYKRLLPFVLLLLRKPVQTQQHDMLLWLP